MKTILLLVLVSTLCWGCGESADNQSPKSETIAVSPPEEIPVVNADTVEVEEEEDENIQSDEVDEYALPPAKSQADLEAFDAREKEAIAAEMAFWGTPRIVDWVDALEDAQDEDGMPVYGKLDQDKFDQLTTKEYLYYYLYHPESWDQMCAEIMVDRGRVQAISTFMPYDYSGDDPSQRQIEGLKTRKDSIALYTKDYLNQADKVSLSLLRFIAQEEWTEMLPRLLEIYKSQAAPNDLILTTFIDLMRKRKFEPWLESDLDQEASKGHYSIIPLSEVNADKIIYYTKEFVKDIGSNE